MKKKTKQSGSYYLELLPADIQQKLIDNIIMLESSELSKDIIELRKEKFLNLADFIGQCFDWESSSEGRDYWEGVLNKGYDGNNLEQGVDEIYDEKTEEIKKLLVKKIDKIVEEMFGDRSDSNPKIMALRNGTGTPGSHYLTFLSQEEQKQYRDNVNSFTPHGFIDHLLDKKYESFYDFIGSSFPFVTSKEGQAYWLEIAGRQVDEDSTESLEDLLSNLKISTKNGEV